MRISSCSFLFSSSKASSFVWSAPCVLSDDELAERDVKFEIRALSPAKRLKELVREVENKVSIFVFLTGSNELRVISGVRCFHLGYKCLWDKA